jgi:5-methylcytosine-specific restriction endonuclease McrA
MSKNPLEMPSLGKVLFGELDEKPRKKRVQLKANERLYIWEHPKKYGRICSICGEKITKMSDLELDHTKPYSKGGTKLALAHRECNRMKASGSLAKIQKTMGFKTTRKKRQSKRKPKKKKASSIFNLPKIKLPKEYL